jgi:tetratricopeptide (TPR) repeat protein
MAPRMSRWFFLLACGCGLIAARGATAPLAPPPDPVVSTPVASTLVPLEKKTPAAVPPSPAVTAGNPVATVPPANSIPFHHNESDLPDSIGAVTVRPVPEPDEAVPAFLQQADYLIGHHDRVAAADYLEKVALNSAVSARDRARVILELADCLQAAQRIGAELCWLKVWMQLYPDRSEVGAVAYRMGALYTQMGLTELARDSYYLALSSAINHGQVQDAGDLAQYTLLTTGTLWALAQNEYGAGNWQRAAELFDRYRHEAPSADARSLTRAEFLQADCYYQLHQADLARTAYEAALKEHPFHSLAPSARLRLYHLAIVAGHPGEAQQELEALVWTVRTAWPRDEARWQKETAELLLALNRKDGMVLPPLLAKSVRLAAQDKTWQADLGHYDKLANLEATIPQAGTPPCDASSPTMVKGRGLGEQDDLAVMQRSIDALAPPTISDHP